MKYTKDLSISKFLDYRNKIDKSFRRNEIQPLETGSMVNADVLTSIFTISELHLK